ncbi:MAG: hypothetical protein MUE33_11580 [Cytophagaceae bacterium]|jgi:hypothetical protein|nr:hypothetical protein [Cytophagaceae bacterium]
MKYSFFFLTLLVSFYSTAQSCQDSYYPIWQGAKWKTTSYNAKGVANGIESYEIKNYTSTATSSTGTIHAVITNEKGKDSTALDYTITCTKGVFKIDMKSIMAGALKDNPQMKDMDVQMEGDELETPHTLYIGQTLPNGKITMKIYSSGTLISTNVINTVSRTVVAKESITTPAGTFECYKISTTYSLEMQIMNMPIKQSFSSNEWIARGTGVVKSESLDKNNKMVGYTLLTEAPKK